MFMVIGCAEFKAAFEMYLVPGEMESDSED